MYAKVICFARIISTEKLFEGEGTTVKKITLLLLLVVFLCTACSQTSTILEEPPLESVADVTEQAPAVPETEDHILLTLEASLADGRTLMLEAFGKQTGEYGCCVREVRVYDGEDLLQTVFAREAIELEWDYGDGGLVGDFYDYTQCWSPEETMEVLDLNFDGNTDFGLFGWPPSNTIPGIHILLSAQMPGFCACVMRKSVCP